MAEKEKEALEKQFSDLPKCKNILSEQEGILKMPLFSNEFGEKPKIAAYITQKVKVKQIFNENNSRWVKFENIETGKEFKCSLKNAYARFKVTKELTPEELQKASAEKAKEKLKNVEYIMTRIQQGRSIDTLMQTAGILKKDPERRPEITKERSKPQKKINERQR